jgi:hypothetical protein
VTCEAAIDGKSISLSARTEGLCKPVSCVFMQARSDLLCITEKKSTQGSEVSHPVCGAVKFLAPWQCRRKCFYDCRTGHRRSVKPVFFTVIDT